MLIFFKVLSNTLKQRSEILLDDSSFAPTHLTNGQDQFVNSGRRGLLCFPGKGAHDVKYANQAIEELSFIVKIFKLSLKESDSFLNSTILLGLRGLTQELILKLLNVSGAGERGELRQGGDQVPLPFPPAISAPV